MNNSGSLMRIAVITVLISAGILSCGTPGASVVAPVGESAAVVETRTVEQPFWKPEGYSLSYPDGIVSEVAVFQYDGLGTLALEEHFDAQNDLVSRKTGAMTSPGVYETVTYDGSGAILGKSVQELRDGLVARESLYDAKGALQSTQENEYDERGRKTGSVVSVEKGGEVAMSYSYRGDDLAETVVRDAGGTPIKRFVRSYEGGLAAREEEFDGQGSIRAIRLFEYEHGFPVRETAKNANGSTISITEFVNDVDGNPVEIRYLDRSGNLLEVRKQRWKRFTKTVAVK